MLSKSGIRDMGEDELRVQRFLSKIKKELWTEMPLQFQDEFNERQLEANYHRSRILSYVILGLITIALSINYLNYRGGASVNVPYYKMLFIEQIVLFCTVLPFSVMFNLRKSRLPRKRFYIWLFWFVVITNCTLISINDQRINGGIVVYTLGALVLAIAPLLDPLSSFFMYLVSYVFLFSGMSFTQANHHLLLGNRVNGALTAIIAFAISCILVNVSKKEFIIKKTLQIQADLDYLTGCLNRGAFIARLTEEIERAKREQTSLSIVMADIDFFKKINDTYGHMAGDLVLTQFAEALKKSFRAYDFIGRFGGEEFMICLPNTSITEAFNISERLRSIVESTKISLMEQHIGVTVSIGVASFNFNETIESLISRADRALYKAKIQRNLVCTC